MRFTDVPASPAPAYQNLGELGALWELVARRPHARVLEIGSLYGGTLWAWAHLPGIETLISVDLVTDWDVIRPDVLEAREQWPEWFTPRVPDFVQIEASSQDPEVVATVAGLDGGGPTALIDFAFIDGDHSYDGVRADWLAWSPLMAPGAIVAFHDTSEHGTSVEPGVVAWCDELRRHLPCTEWTDPDGVGICAFQLP